MTHYNSALNNSALYRTQKTQIFKNKVLQSLSNTINLPVSFKVNWQLKAIKARKGWKIGGKEIIDYKTADTFDMGTNNDMFKNLFITLNGNQWRQE